MFFHAVVNVLPKGRGSPESGKLLQGGSLGRSEKFPRTEGKPSQIICIYAGNGLYNHCGGNSEEVPPVLMPNTEVKLFYAEGTWLATARKTR